MDRNADGVDPKDAFLREVIERDMLVDLRCIWHIMMQKTKKVGFCNISSIYLVLGPNPPYPERMPYAATELNSNSNAPAEDPGIFKN